MTGVALWNPQNRRRNAVIYIRRKAGAYRHIGTTNMKTVSGGVCAAKGFLCRKKAAAAAFLKIYSPKITEAKAK